MKALIKDGDFESYKLAALKKPVPNEGELLIKILKVSICGSDIALYRWNDGKTFFLNNIIHDILLLEKSKQFALHSLY